jgi:hypothetical protein
MFSRFRQAIFGIPLLSQAPRHASYQGPTTATAIAQSQQASNMASTTNGASATSGNNVEVATVANGCFWGTQHVFDHHMKGRLIKTEVGYTVSVKRSVRRRTKGTNTCSSTFASCVICCQCRADPRRHLPIVKSVAEGQDMLKHARSHSIQARVRGCRTMYSLSLCS